jgi:hypothetical protein
MDKNRIKPPKFFQANSNCKKFFFLNTLILIVVMLIDSLLSDASSVVNKSLSESTRIVLFSTIGGIAIISGSITTIYAIRRVKTNIGSKNKVILLISLVLPFIQFTILGILILITSQIIFIKQYSTLLLVTTQALSWSMGVIVMGMMSFKFIQWYRAKRSLLILLYLVSTLMFSGTLGATIIPKLQ